MRRSFLTSAPALGLCASLGIALAVGRHAATAQTPEVVAFTNVTVVAMDANRVTPNQHVVVTKDRITAVGPAAKTPIPAGAVRVEGKGRFVMPGLAEMHGHVPAGAAAEVAHRRRAVPLRRQRRDHRARHAGCARPSRAARGGAPRRDPCAEPLSGGAVVQRQHHAEPRSGNRPCPPRRNLKAGIC